LWVSPRRWWLWSGSPNAALGVLALLVGLVWIAPFDDFGPMHDGRRGPASGGGPTAGIEGSRVYEVNKSEDTKLVNATYRHRRHWADRAVTMSAAGATRYPLMAHEMGHLSHHTLAVILGAALLATLSLFVVHRVAGRLIGRYAHRFGFDRLSDVASLPLLVLVGGVVSFLVTPAVLAYSRWQEHEADRFALELTRDNPAGAMVFVRLQQENLGVPRPGLLYTLWRGSHPSPASRVEFANTYRPWDEGRALKYEKLFRVEGRETGVPSTRRRQVVP
jgi:hypothetical protein